MVRYSGNEHTTVYLFKLAVIQERSIHLLLYFFFFNCLRIHKPLGTNRINLPPSVFPFTCYMLNYAELLVYSPPSTRKEVKLNHPHKAKQTLFITTETLKVTTSVLTRIEFALS